MKLSLTIRKTFLNTASASMDGVEVVGEGSDSDGWMNWNATSKMGCTSTDSVVDASVGGVMDVRREGVAGDGGGRCE